MTNGLWRFCFSKEGGGNSTRALIAKEKPTLSSP